MNFGDFVLKDGLAYMVTGVPTGDVTTYKLKAVHRAKKSDKELVSTYRLIPVGSDKTVASLDGYKRVSKGTAMAQTLAYGKVKVDFDTAKGSDVDSKILDTGSLLGDVTVPTNGKKTFSGWSLTEDGKDTIDTDKYKFTEDLTLFAVWSTK